MCNTKFQLSASTFISSLCTEHLWVCVMNFVMSYEYVMQLAVSQLTHVHVATQTVVLWSRDIT